VKSRGQNNRKNIGCLDSPIFLQPNEKLNLYSHRILEKDQVLLDSFLFGV